MLRYSPTPIHQIINSRVQHAGVSLYIKREDINHPTVSGNKWWKLKYNLAQAQKDKHTTILTFGGAYSNHIYATAAATNSLKLKSIGIIRGERIMPLNPTLSFAERQGMKLHFISRTAYRKKTEPDFNKQLMTTWGPYYLIPEGGTNALAIKGCEEFAKQLEEEMAFDYLCIPIGTGGTLAGLINVMPHKKIIGFSALKGGAFLYDEVRKSIRHNAMNWKIDTSYSWGGYGKMPPELKKFIHEFEDTHNIPLDPVYTGKMMYGIYDLLERGFFQPNTKILAVHTGGLQGRLSK